jgi:hypothetical protein
MRTEPAMPRYFFHLHNDIDTTDDEGAEFPDDAAARAHAIANARDVAVESIAKGHLNLGHYIEIVREDGAPAFRVGFGEAITVTGQA